MRGSVQAAAGYCNLGPSARLPAIARHNRCDDRTKFSDALVEFLEMMDRPMTMADAEAVGGCDRSADPGLGVAHGSRHVLAFGEFCCNRRGERAAGAVGIFCGDAR